MAPTYAIVTFGCRVNQADSLRLEASLVGRGAVAAPAEAADLVIVNSCSVTASADQGTRQMVRRIARLNPAARIVVTGCYASREADTLQQLSGVHRVVANDEKEGLVDDLASWLERTQLPVAGVVAESSESHEGPCGQPLAPGLGGRTAFTLRVQTGCDEPCAYCVIPSTRGHGRSQALAVIVEEVQRLERAGYREIVLTGVHLGSYGRDLVPRRSLGELLAEVAASTRTVLFRVGSLEPMDCTSEVRDLLTTEAAFAPHFHLPLQHASDDVLGAMRRPYRLAYYAALVDDLRQRVPDASIGTDLLVGFPGETHADAACLEAYLEASPLTHAHVFPYSDRPGTPAVRMTNKLPGALIRERAGRLRAIGQRLTERFRTSQLGGVRPALTTDDGTMAVTDNYLKVHLARRHPRNRRVLVRIDRAGPRVEGTVVGDGAQVRGTMPSAPEPDGGGRVRGHA